MKEPPTRQQVFGRLKARFRNQPEMFQEGVYYRVRLWRSWGISRWRKRNKLKDFSFTVYCTGEGFEIQ